MSKITIDKQVPGHWRVTLDNPPVNTVDDGMYDEVFDLVEPMEAEPALKVVTFESANPDFFLAHYGIGEATSRFGIPRWREAAVRLARSDAVSIAVIRGRREWEVPSSHSPAISGSRAETPSHKQSSLWPTNNRLSCSAR